MENDLRIYFAGRNTKPGHDKVWGYCFLADEGQMTPRSGQKVFVFYGATGKAFTVKQHEQSWELINLKQSKERKGYRQIGTDDVLALYPNFWDDMERKLTFVILADDTYAAVKS
jgi:hypothetical protein